MELNELIHQAQEAMDQGDYRRAAAACAHALGAYPTCLSAHRLLGESCLEQGEVERATEHFERTLALDPLNVVARLGLGVACEERGDPRGAYTNYLRAWDLNPALDQIRDELVRLRAALGTGGRLHLTRAGLASTYLRGGQFGRAAAEWRAVLAAEPEGDRARLALAEVLWRQGDEAGAAAACREILRGAPENARALAILAAIELRRGEESGRFTAERYRTTDPAGDVVALLRAVRPDVDLTALTQPAPLADFVYEETAPEPAAVDAAELVGNHHAAAGALGVGHIPAPDLWDSVVRDLGPMPFVPETAEPALDVVPFAWADGAATAELSAPAPAVDGMAGLAAETGAPPAHVPAGEPEGSELAALFVEPAATADLAPEPVAPTEAEDPFAAFGGADPFAEMEQALQGDGDGPAAMAAEPAAPWPAFEPAAIEPEPEPAAAAPETGVDRFITADGRVDLTVGWDQLDRVLDEATPKRHATNGYDDLLAEFDAGGIAPFSAVEPGDEAAWEPFSADELMAEEPVAAVEPAPPATGNGRLDDLDALVLEHDWGLSNGANDWPAVAPGIGATGESAWASQPATTELGALSGGWDNIGQELAAAIPEQEPSGYTEILRNIDSEGGVPFDLADPEDEIDPLATPDSVGQPLDFDDLLTVTSRDGTASLSLEPDLPAAEPFDAAAFADAFAGTVPGPAADDPTPFGGFDDLEPFSVAGLAFDLDGGAASQVDFSDVERYSVAEAAAAVDFAVDQTAGFDADPWGLAPAANGLDHAAEPVLAGAGPGSEAPLDWIGAANAAEAVVAAIPQAEVIADALQQWPTVGAGTSVLFGMGRTGLFARLREEKAAMVATGQLVVDRSLAPVPANGASGERVEVGPVVAAGAGGQTVAVAERVDAAPTANGTAAVAVAGSDDGGFNLIGMRERLKGDAKAAAEIASELESAVAAGVASPLLLRVLGEAYLKLGRGEQAAAQFRQAMALRGRRR